MNSFQLFGVVKDVQHKEFDQTGGILTTFTLEAQVGNAKTFLKCKSWQKAFTAVAEGMSFELTRYYPRNESYVDRNGNKRNVIYIWVENMKYLGESSGGIDWGDTKKPETTQPQEYKPIERPAPASVGDLFKKAMEQEEETIDLDWMEELGVEKPKYDQSYVEEIEKINSSVKVEVQDGEAGSNRQETGE